MKRYHVLHPIILALALILTASAVTAQTGVWYNGSLDEVKVVAAEQNKLVLILFSSGDG